jgi:hypothetical protein
MIVSKSISCLVLLIAVTATVGCDQNVSAQRSNSEAISFATLLRMFADQPDHMADRTIIINDSVIKMKFAKKQDRIRQEFYPLDQANTLKDESFRYYKIVTISKFNEPTLAFDPQEMTYTEAPDDFNLVSFDIEAFLKNASTELGKIKAENVGTEILDGRKANKIRITFEGETEEMFFYFAKDMRNLFLKMDSGTIKQIRGTYTVSNISFDVPDSIFQVPLGYKKVDFNSFITAIKRKALK